MLCTGFGLKWDSRELLEVILERDDSSTMAEHNARLLEAETATANSIPFDQRWYSIPVLARAQMIASRLGRAWLDSLKEEQIVQKGRQPGG